MPAIAIGECISFGWTTFKKRPWFFIQAALVIVGVYLVLGIVAAIVGLNAKEVGDALGDGLSSIAGVFTGIGTIALYLKAHDDVASARIKDLWHPELFIKYLLASILMGLIVFVGFLLLIVPGIIFSLMLAFTLYLVVDRNLGPINALKESRRLTRGNRWSLALLGLALVFLNIVGLVALGIGLFVTVPVSGLAMVHAYRTLQRNTLPAG